MRIVVVTPPLAAPVSLDQAKAQCRATGFTDDDALIQSLIATAAYWLDGPGGWLGRALGPQQLEARLDAFPPLFEDMQQVFMRPWDAMRIKLHYPPVQSVQSVTYIDPNGVEQTLDPSTYMLNSGVLEPAYGQGWPYTRFQRDSVRIGYTAGYAVPPGAPLPAQNPVPPPIQQAILLMVSHLYNHPDAVVGVEARDSSTEMPLGVSSLLTPFRVWES